MKGKLSIGQSTLLRVIAERYQMQGGIPWCPPFGMSYAEGRSINLSGVQVTSTVRALINKGLATPYPNLGDSACMITELGREVAEQEKGKPLTWIDYYDQQLAKERREAAESKGEDW